MKKIIIIAVGLIVGYTAKAQTIQSKQNAPKTDTVAIKATLSSDQVLIAINQAVEMAKKGLPSSSTITAADATSALNLLEAIRQQAVLLYNERHKSAEEMSPAKK